MKERSERWDSAGSEHGGGGPRLRNAGSFWKLPETSRKLPRKGKGRFLRGIAKVSTLILAQKEPCQVPGPQEL